MKDRLEYNVDIVFCIDATGSMGPLLDMVKENALTFYRDLMNEMTQKGKNIDRIRARIVAFRDYMADGKNAMLTTDFYDLREESDRFDAVIRSLHPEGGGDEPEDALEALAYAIKSKWTRGGDKRRHLIIVWSDASTHPIGYSAAAMNYPRKMVKTFDELTNMWDGDAKSGGLMDSNAKRLLIFAPEAEYWTDIAETWDNVIHFPSEAGSGLDRLSYQEILAQIINSIA